MSGAEQEGLRGRVTSKIGPGTRAWRVAKRTIVGTYEDGFIHAGNLAYLSMFAIFPFFILGAAIFSAFGEANERAMTINTVLVALPPTARDVIEPVAYDAINARSGWLLWAGAAVALWTASSLIETVRDILRRAYRTKPARAFWVDRLFSTGVILGAALLLVLSLFVQIGIGMAQQMIDAAYPQLMGEAAEMHLSRIAPAFGLFGSLFMIFLLLTPPEYRGRQYPKWPGAFFTTLWWIIAATLLPIVLREFFSYSLTYGSLAGIMITLFFFWLVGLGTVIGAELNAALAGAAGAEEADELAS
ncbi:YihY/virulence factor BrkB family protein [Qipengyuania sp. DGS5-3]|uniref:YihY/virulence factor BrkB family protein n=1 Tax=Qipengyuania sp. DGS5-3 TaxID=3349632 RepID=UPI0036D30230